MNETEEQKPFRTLPSYRINLFLICLVNHVTSVNNKCVLCIADGAK
jgi:hypothetical protein